MRNRRSKGVLSIITALAFLFGTITTTPVYASTKITETVKEAYINTLETRTAWGDLADVCKSGVDYETIYKDYYKALEAYDEDSDSSYYGLVYTISSKSSKNSSSSYGKPIDSVEYSVVGAVNEDGDKEVTVYKCKTTTWLKKISGEYKITKVTRTIAPLEDYTEAIEDDTIVNEIAALSENFLENSETANIDMDESTIDTIGSIESEISHPEKGSISTGINSSSTNYAPKLTITTFPTRSNNNKVKISGKLTDRKDASPELYINGETVAVGADGNWSAEISLKEGPNPVVIKGVNENEKETQITKTIVREGAASTKPAVSITSIVQTASSDVVTVTGTVTDESGTIPTVYVNNTAVAVNGTDGTWTKELSLRKGENSIIIRAVNTQGKETIIKKKITYMPTNN